MRKLSVVLLLALTIAAAVFVGLRDDILPQSDPYLEHQRLPLRSGFNNTVTAFEDPARYQLEASIDPDSSSYEGQVVIQVSNTSEECLEHLNLRLYANAVHIYGGQLAVERIQVDGRSASSRELAPTHLQVVLPDCLQIGDELELKAEFRGQVAQLPNSGYGILASSSRGSPSQAGIPCLASLYRRETRTAFPQQGMSFSARSASSMPRSTCPKGSSPFPPGQLH